MEDYEAVNKQAYDSNADYFSQIYNNTKLSGPFDLLFQMFAVRTRKVLDLGCGNGFFAKRMALSRINVTSLDNSIEMLKKCDDNKILASIETLPFKSESFDGVFANCSLLHLPKEKFPAALEESRRLLIQYGTLLLTMKTGVDYEGIVEADGIRRYQSIYSNESLDSIMQNYFLIAESKDYSIGNNSLSTLLCIKP